MCTSERRIISVNVRNQIRLMAPVSQHRQTRRSVTTGDSHRAAEFAAVIVVVFDTSANWFTRPGFGYPGCVYTS